MINHPNRNRRQPKITAVAAKPHDHDADYAAFLAGVRTTFAGMTHAGGGAFFTTDADGLFDQFLDLLPADRQVHTCSACRQFFRAFGGLVAITPDGAAHAAMWNEEFVPEFYGPAVATMRHKVRHARVTGVFLSRASVWGTERTGEWTHVAVSASPGLLFTERTRTPGQAMAARREDFQTVARALAEFSPNLLHEALRVLKADAVNRAVKFVGPVKWLLDLHTHRAAQKNARHRDNILWRAIACAPDGYCHPRASVVGSLLEDIAANLPFDRIRSNFNAKVHGLRYQRPQAPPAAGNIAQAEKIVEQLGIARSLDRRFARLDELHTIWTPRASASAGEAGGVFGHLRPKDTTNDAAALDLPETTLTWAKFSATVLPQAEAMEFIVPFGRGPFVAFVTAVHPDAPPILKWDHDDARNPVSVYAYAGGSYSISWDLPPGCAVAVTAVAPSPWLWGSNPMPQMGGGAVLVLAGALDQCTDQGNALFPETLRGELHSVRATIEAYSRQATIGGRHSASACGYAMQPGPIGVGLVVTSAGRRARYLIDRWD